MSIIHTGLKSNNNHQKHSENFVLKISNDNKVLKKSVHLFMNEI